MVTGVQTTHPGKCYTIAHVRYIKILTSLWGFLVIFLYLVWLSLCYSGFQVTRMIEGFFWVWNFRFRVFLVRKFWQVFFGVAWFKWGFLGVFKENHLKIRVSTRVSRPHRSAWHFWGVNFWSRDVFGFVGSPRAFLGFWFCPPFDRARHLKPRVLPPKVAPAICICNAICICSIVQIILGTFGLRLYKCITKR